MTNKSRKFDPRHLDAHLGIGDVPIYCPIVEILLLAHRSHYGLDRISLSPVASSLFVTMAITQEILRLCASRKGISILHSNDFGLLRTSTHRWVVSYHTTAVAGYFAPICIDRAMLYRAAFLLRAILHSCVHYAWSCDLGVLCDLKLSLVIFAWRKKIRQVQSITWYSFEHHVYTNANLWLCRIPWE